MRAISGVLAAFAVLVSLSASVEAGKSRSVKEGSFFAGPGAARIFGSGHPSFAQRRHGSSMVFHHRSHRFSRSHPFAGTIVPPFRGTIVPPFQIGRPFYREGFFRHRFDNFFFGGSGGSRQTIIILQPIPVPIADAAVRETPVKPQIVDLQSSRRSSGSVQVFTPSP